MKAMTNHTTQRTGRFTLAALLALLFLCHVPHVHAQATSQEEALTPTETASFASPTHRETGNDQARLRDFEARTNRKRGSGNASGGEDDDEEDIVIVLDGYQSVSGGRLLGRGRVLRGEVSGLAESTSRKRGSGNASGGEDDDEEDIVIVLDGYQSVGQGNRLAGIRDLDGFDEQTARKRGSGNASGGEDDDEEDIVIVLDGYQSISGGHLTGIRGLDGFDAQTNRKRGSGNASGGEDDDEEDIVIVLDGYQSVSGGRLLGRGRVLRGEVSGLAESTSRKRGSGNASGGEDDDEEDIVIVLDGYQSVGEADVRSSEASIEAAELPQQATLHGNYPNPFNPATTIRFELPEAQAVRLVVYNAIGQQVQVLVDGSLGSGPHEVRFEAGHLASGLYLARLETPAGVSVQRMMLAK